MAKRKCSLDDLIFKLCPQRSLGNSDADEHVFVPPKLLNFVKLQKKKKRKLDFAPKLSLLENKSSAAGQPEAGETLHQCSLTRRIITASGVEKLQSLGTAGSLLGWAGLRPPLAVCACFAASTGVFISFVPTSEYD